MTKITANKSGHLTDRRGRYNCDLALGSEEEEQAIRQIVLTEKQHIVVQCREQSRNPGICQSVILNELPLVLTKVCRIVFGRDLCLCQQLTPEMQRPVSDLYPIDLSPNVRTLTRNFGYELKVYAVEKTARVLARVGMPKQAHELRIGPRIEQSYDDLDTTSNIAHMAGIAVTVIGRLDGRYKGASSQIVHCASVAIWIGAKSEQVLD